MSSVSPVAVTDHFKITQHGVPASEVVFNTVTMESGDVICVRMSIEQTAPPPQPVAPQTQNGEQPVQQKSPVSTPAPAKRSLVVIDVNANKVFVKTNAQAESSIMHPKNKRWIGLKVGTGLQVFDLRERKRISGCDMKKDFPLFWRWIGENELVVISPQNVHHWGVDENVPTGTLTHRFSRPNEAPFNTATIINYHVDVKRESHIVVTLSKDKNSSDVKGLAQFFSNGKLEVIPAHAANFFEFTPLENEESETLLVTAYHLSGTTGEMAIRNLTNPSVRKYSFSLYSNEDFPVIVEQCEQLAIIYIITKFGGCYIFDIDTGTLLFRDKISQENIFCGNAYSDPSKKLLPGVVCVNKAAQVQSVLTNPKLMISHCMRSGQTMIALRMALRLNAPNSSDLWWSHFDHLLKEKKRVAEALKLVIESPRNVLRTMRALDELEQFESGALVQYYKILSTRQIELNAEEYEKAQNYPEIMQMPLKKPRGKSTQVLQLVTDAISEAQTNGDQISSEFDEKVISNAANHSLWDEVAQYGETRSDSSVDQIIIQKLLQDEEADILTYGKRRSLTAPKWIESVLEPLIDQGQYDRAQRVGIHILQNHPECLQSIIDLFIAEEKQLIPILEHSLGSEHPTMEMYTELAILYARHQHEQLSDFLEFNVTRTDVSTLLATFAQLSLWDDMKLLQNHIEPEEFIAVVTKYCKNLDNWDHGFFATVVSRCSSPQIVDEVIKFYITKFPNHLNELLLDISDGVVKPDVNRVRQEVEEAGYDQSIMSVIANEHLPGDVSPHHFIRSSSGTLHASQSIDDIAHSSNSPPVNMDNDFFERKLPPIPKHLMKKKQENTLLDMDDDMESPKHKHPHLNPRPSNRQDDSLFVHLHDPLNERRVSSRTPPVVDSTYRNEEMRRNRSADHLLLTLDDEEESTQHLQPKPLRMNRSEGKLKSPTSPKTPTNGFGISTESDSGSELLFIDELSSGSGANSGNGFSALDELIGPVKSTPEKKKRLDSPVLVPSKQEARGGSLIEFEVKSEPTITKPMSAEEFLKNVEISRNDGSRSFLERYKGFTISQKLGQGGQASIFLCKDELGQPCVLKTMKLNNMQELEMALQESNTLAVLKHPNIVSINKVFVHEDEAGKSVCFSMPYYSYGDLDRIIFNQKQKWPEKFIINCLGQIADALAFIHSKNIMHRDLKPANIFVQPRMHALQLFLGDFGLSKTEGEKKDTGPVGTQIYMAPEVRNHQPYDFKADVFSLGCIMVQMMSLKMRRDIVVELQTAHIGGRDYFKELRMDMVGYTPQLIDLCLCMLHPIPHLRPTAEQIARHPIVLQGGF